MGGSRKIGFTCGIFDLLHAGHLMMLEECKDNCDYLIVGLAHNTFGRAGKNEPVESLFQRYMRLRAVKWIDEIYVYDSEEDLGVLLHFLSTKYEENLTRFLDETYEKRGFNFSDLPIKIHFNSRKHPYSSSGLRNLIKSK